MPTTHVSDVANWLFDLIHLQQIVCELPLIEHEHEMFDLWNMINTFPMPTT
jgi:hypothetical protein